MEIGHSVPQQIVGVWCIMQIMDKLWDMLLTPVYEKNDYDMTRL